MVGPPKRIEDLRRLDANIRIVCAKCKHARVFDRELLIAELARRKKTTEWRVLPHMFRCRQRGCGSKEVRVEVIPFAERPQPAVLVRFLKAVDAYLAAMQSVQLHCAADLTRVGRATGEMHQARRALVMWVTYGVTPDDEP